MHTTLLVIHISTMILSIVLTLAASTLGFLKKRSSNTVINVAMVATVVGLSSGGILLLGAPLSMRCALLAAYLLGFGLLYHFAFGDGRVAKSVFLKAVIPTKDS